MTDLTLGMTKLGAVAKHSLGLADYSMHATLHTYNLSWNVHIQAVPRVRGQFMARG